MRLKLISLLLPLAACAAPHSTGDREPQTRCTPESSGSDIEFEIITLKFASAEEVAQTIAEQLEVGNHCRAVPSRGFMGCGSSASVSPPQAHADQRTNSLLIMAPVADMRQLKELVAALDVAPRE